MINESSNSYDLGGLLDCWRGSPRPTLLLHLDHLLHVLVVDGGVEHEVEDTGPPGHAVLLLPLLLHELVQLHPAPHPLHVQLAPLELLPAVMRVAFSLLHSAVFTIRPEQVPEELSMVTLKYSSLHVYVYV